MNHNMGIINYKSLVLQGNSARVKCSLWHFSCCTWMYSRCTRQQHFLSNGALWRIFIYKIFKLVGIFSELRKKHHPCINSFIPVLHYACYLFHILFFQACQLSSFNLGIGHSFKMFYNEQNMVAYLTYTGSGDR